MMKICFDFLHQYEPRGEPILEGCAAFSVTTDQCLINKKPGTEPPAEVDICAWFFVAVMSGFERRFREPDGLFPVRRFCFLRQTA